MVTSEYEVYFIEPVSEFSLFVLGARCDGFIIADDLQSIQVEYDGDERQFISLLAEVVEVEKITFIKTIRTLEPDWLSLEA